MIIRKATPEDCESIVDLEKECFIIPWSRKSILTDLENNPNAHYYVAVDGISASITGYIGMWLVLDDAQITNLAVTKESRNKGTGTSLVNYLCRQAVQMGAKTITLEVSDKNTTAVTLYKRAGFVPVSKRTGYYSYDDSDAIIMLKVLE